MSASPPIATKHSRRSETSLCAISDLTHRSKLFDHLVGAGRKARRHFEAERLRCDQVNDELELGGLDDRQVGGPGTLEDLTGHDAGLAKHVQNISPVAHQ